MARAGVPLYQVLLHFCIESSFQTCFLLWFCLAQEPAVSSFCPLTFRAPCNLIPQEYNPIPYSAASCTFVQAWPFLPLHLYSCTSPVPSSPLKPYQAFETRVSLHFLHKTFPPTRLTFLPVTPGSRLLLVTIDSITSPGVLV